MADPAPRSLILRSTLRGAVAGIVLSFIYTVLTVLALGISQVLGANPPEQIFQASLGVAGATLCVGPFALMIGFVPGVIAGLLGGFLIGIALAALHSNLTPACGAAVGLAVALLLVAGALVLMVPAILASERIESDRLLFSLYWLMAPGLLVILGLTWVGWSVLRPAQGASIAVRP